VLVKSERNNKHKKGTIIDLETKSNLLIIQLSESDEQIAAKYNDVERDRPLLAGDFVTVSLESVDFTFHYKPSKGTLVSCL